MAQAVLQSAQTFLDRIPKPVFYTLAGIGLVSVLRKATIPLCELYRYYLQRRPDYPGIYGKGSYVVITGASDGMGEVLAYEFAGMGFGLVLVGRNEDKLNRVKEKCVVELRTKVVTVVADLATTDVAVFQGVADRVKDLDVSILINNAGAINYGPFTALPIAELCSLVSLNILSHTVLTRLILPQLLARGRKCLIINTASFTGITPTGYMAVYSATKAYMRFFSLALREETKGKVDVFAAAPARVNTKMPGYPGVDSNNTSIAVTVSGILNDAPRLPESFCSFKHSWLYYKLSFFSFQKRISMVTAVTKSRREAAAKAKSTAT